MKMGTPRWRPPEGQFPATCPPGTIGWLIKHYNYDGVGRLYRTTSPLTAPEGYIFNGSGVRANRSERFFYDGTRRVQELLTDPILVSAEQGEDVITMQQENEQTGGGMGSGGNGGGGGGETGGSATLNYCRAVYIWGPGDSPTSGVDELLLQIDPTDTGPGSLNTLGGKPWYAVNDAQGDLVALLHQKPSTNTIEIAAQWTYSPYGEVLTYEQFHPHPVVVFGHKSLVADRLDAPALSWDTGSNSLSDTQRLIPGAKLISYARNRTYAPSLGRWLQQDPNASGQSVVVEAAFHGHASDTPIAEVSVGQRIGDGLSVYAYVRGNPIAGRDSLGLYLEPTEAVGLGIAVKRLASDLIGEYSFNLELDANWASDWSQRDNDHTRLDARWVDDIVSSFLEENVGEFEEEADGPAMAAGGGFVRNLVRGGKIARAGRAAWTAAQAAIEMHHLLSMFMGGHEQRCQVPGPDATAPRQGRFGA